MEDKSSTTVTPPTPALECPVFFQDPMDHVTTQPLKVTLTVPIFKETSILHHITKNIPTTTEEEKPKGKPKGKLLVMVPTLPTLDPLSTKPTPPVLQQQPTLKPLKAALVPTSPTLDPSSTKLTTPVLQQQPIQWNSITIFLMDLLLTKVMVKTIQEGPTATVMEEPKQRRKVKVNAEEQNLVERDQAFPT